MRRVEVHSSTTERYVMGLRIELPEDLAHDLEEEAVRRHVSVVEIIREALHTWRVSREAAENDREREVLSNVVDGPA
jgi:predicted transcriptional regulator